MVVSVYADVKDAKTGQTLFSKDAWRCFAKLMGQVKRGRLFFPTATAFRSSL